MPRNMVQLAVERDEGDDPTQREYAENNEDKHIARGTARGADCSC